MGLLTNKRNLVNYNSLICKACGGPFTQQQINKSKSKHSVPQYCSIACTRKGGSYNEEAVKEPRNEVERIAFDLKIIEGRAELITDEQALVMQHTPIDDSPDAEKLLRSVVCPNPNYGGYNRITKYDVKTKDLGYNKRRSYRE